MIFRELVLQNFGPYRGRHVIDLTPQKDDVDRPIILFGGMNGGGKTTLMDAIRLVLYGQRAQCSTRGNLGYGEFLSQCVHSQILDSEPTRLELAFEHIRHDRLVDLRVVRTWTKPPKDGKDQLGILEADWPDTALANTWDEYIENILPLGISNLFLFDGEQVKELAELDIPPESVINAISTLLGLELVERLAIDLDVLVSRKRKALANQSQLATLEGIEVKLQQQLHNAVIAREELELLEQQLTKAQQNHRDARTEFRIEGGKIAAERSELETKIKHIQTAVDQSREQLRQLSAEFLPLQLVLPLLKQAQIQAQNELNYQEAKITRDVLAKRDEKLLAYLSEIEIIEDKVAQIQQFLAKENQDIQEKLENSKNPWLNLDPEELKQLEKSLATDLPQQLNQATATLAQLVQLESEIDSYERQLAVAASPEAYEKLDYSLKIAEKELLDVQTAYEIGRRRIEEANKAIAQSKKELELYTEQSLAHQNNEHIIQSAAKVKQTLQLFRDHLTLKKLNKLEEEVTECFRYLLHKSDLVHRIAIDSNNFALSLYDFQGKVVPKHRLSAGEKQLLAIAFLWGLARVSGRNLPIAIDTPLGRLDSSHRQNLLERYFPTASHQVILLSTDTEIGYAEVTMLRQTEAIAREYLLKYDPIQSLTQVQPGYFW
ncbi:DNA sulfur modification protein DndD [Gloeocapsa sp. PCC 73106]|uniref:DNA sulfur modification protein DndD n=1 Tax=Gloeocapsa sp. PCC 73106 TaxID=102232 RepID=UPI0002AC365D|nr:DNA sulfur modification protein DndD [Gloeocapsa sp. PCC 73106]ELR97880.1 DNA sulfur modification protein DndD [Gloeocapsa sp. PCC 73106]